jgi:multisubunit Na+/H+ antiporter MnhE subunit
MTTTETLLDWYATARPTITEVEYERMVDRMVHARLRRDRSYLHAENAEEQSAAEERITEEIERELAEVFEVA